MQFFVKELTVDHCRAPNERGGLLRRPPRPVRTPCGPSFPSDLQIFRTEIQPLVLGILLTESQLVRGFRKYITLGVLREIRMKLPFRIGKVDLLERLWNPLTWVTIAQRISKYITLWVFRDIRLKLLSRLSNVNLLKVLGNLLTESQLLRGFLKYITLGVLREIRMKLPFRIGKANLLERLWNPLTWVTIAQRIPKIYNTLSLQTYKVEASFQTLTMLTSLKYLITFSLSHNCWEDFKNI